MFPPNNSTNFVIRQMKKDKTKYRIAYSYIKNRNIKFIKYTCASKLY